MSEFAETVLTLAKEGDFDTIKAAIAGHEAGHMQELRAYEVTVANRDARIAQLEAELAAVQQGVQRIQANCYSDNDEDYWHDRPDDCVFVEGLKVGETFELKASVRAWSETFRVTKAPDDTSDEYEVELVSTNAPISATHPTQQGLDAQRLTFTLSHLLGGEDMTEKLMGLLHDSDGLPWAYEIAVGEIDAALAAQAKQAD